MDKNDYILRITNATPAELVAINYEMLLGGLSVALSAQTDEGFCDAVKHAKTLLDELILVLNPDYEISQELMRIYLYVNGLLLEAMRKRGDGLIEEAKRIMAELSVSWQKIAEDDRKANPPHVSSEEGKIYSGLTYDKQGKPVETEVGTNSRSFEG